MSDIRTDIHHLCGVIQTMTQMYAAVIAKTYCPSHGDHNDNSECVPCAIAASILGTTVTATEKGAQ